MIAGMQVPTLDEITKKEQTIKEALNYKFNDKDIEDVSPCRLVDPFFWTAVFSSDIIYVLLFFFYTCSLQIVKEKDRFRKAPPNYAMKKTQLLKDKVKSISLACKYMIVFKNKYYSSIRAVIAGNGRGERRRRQSQGDPGRAERAGGASRSTGQTEDQEHLCNQVQ